MTVDSDTEKGVGFSIRQCVFGLLEKNPLLTAKVLCKLLDLSHGRYQVYVSKLKHKCKSDHRSNRGSKCLIYAWRGWSILQTSLSIHLFQELYLQLEKYPGRYQATNVTAARLLTARNTET